MLSIITAIMQFTTFFVVIMHALEVHIAVKRRIKSLGTLSSQVKTGPVAGSLACLYEDSKEGVTNTSPRGALLTGIHHTNVSLYAFPSLSLSLSFIGPNHGDNCNAIPKLSFCPLYQISMGCMNTKLLPQQHQIQRSI